MPFRLLATLLLVCSMAGCASLFPKKDKKPPVEPAMRDQANDPSFQSFIGLLRKAVANRDKQMLASLMTPTFGFRLEPLGEGDGVFQYWDENNLWDELQSVVNQKFVPSGNFMVAPPQFVTDPVSYHGYRAGMTQVNGAWKFAYYVSG